MIESITPFKKIVFFVFSMGAVILVCPSVHADCGLSLGATSINLNWNINFTHVTVELQMSRSTSDACSYSLGFSKGGAASYAARRGTDSGKEIRYQLYQDSALTKILEDGADVSSTDEVVIGGFPAGALPTTQTLVFYLEIPYNLATTPSLVASGSYTDSFTINVYDGTTPPFLTPIDSQVVNLTITVPSMIALSLVDTGGAFVLGQLSRNVSFSTLTPGSSASLDLRVRSNAGFAITFSSTNDGRLAHTTPGKNSFVPFSLYVNGALLNLTNSSSVPVVGLSGSGSTNLDGFAYPMKVVIGSLPVTALAGPHSDDVTITAITTE